VTASAPALALLLGVTLSACRADGAAAAAGAVAVVDDAGDTVRLRAPARRIVSLIPTATEILLRAGLGARVVGRTAWCDWPPGAASIPSVGGGFPPSIEAVAARRPDLVVLYHSAVNRQAAAQLETLGIAVLELRTDRIADVSRATRLLGVLAAATSSADRVAHAFERGLVEAAGDLPAGRSGRPSVLLLAWPDPTIALGATAFMSELLELAGGRNAFGDVMAASAPVSLESIALRDPEIVFLADSTGAAMLARPEWKVVPAVRAGRVLAPLPPPLTRAGLRAPLALRRLRVALTLSRNKALR
jgi:iron complex transport system substrate-binding protein